MGWFRVTDGRLCYRGVTREPFALWLQTPRGAAALTSTSLAVGFSLFGRRRAARRVLWRELQATLADERVQAVVREQARVYTTLLATMAFLEPLPRATVDLHRLVVVPRLLLGGRSHQLMHEQLSPLLEARDLHGRDAMRDFLVTTLVDEMDRAFVFARPRPRRPVPPNEEWASVGVDLHFTWDAPDWSGPAWPGHHYVYEQPRGGLGRRQCRRLRAAIAEMDKQMARWPAVRRRDTLQRAAATFGV